MAFVRVETTMISAWEDPGLSPGPDDDPYEQIAKHYADICAALLNSLRRGYFINVWRRFMTVSESLGSMPQEVVWVSEWEEPGDIFQNINGYLKETGCPWRIRLDEGGRDPYRINLVNFEGNEDELKQTRIV